jgi:CBS domain containing-hemolysin-like protein
LNEDGGQSLGVLIGTLVGLVFLSAFFAGTETALMSVNRYRLRTLRVPAVAVHASPNACWRGRTG